MVVQMPGHRIVLQNGFDLRSKQEPLGALPNVEGLFPQPVACQNQARAWHIPKRHAEHTAKPLQKLEARFFVKVDNNFGVCVGLEDMAGSFELRAKLLEVVNLSVQYYPDRFAFVGARLVAAGQVNNAQPTHPQCDSSAEIMAFIIWASMHDGAAHSCQQRLRGRSRLPQIKDSVDPAHLLA